ncbi:MAG: hypothetical protein LBD14_06275 [Puniceicoccales bacterium]|jgi:hypothetical protein|nr:hypothetical protein [Puniceicoccales bacterium]
MGNFISNQIAKFVNQRIAGIGTVDSLDVGHDSITAALALCDEPVPVRLEITGIRWSAGEGKFHVHFQSVRASKKWIQGIIDLAVEKAGNRISVPDKISLAPLKMMFPKA